MGAGYSPSDVSFAFDVFDAQRRAHAGLCVPSRNIVCSVRSNRTIAMTLEQLRIFVAVAEREHLTKAASALHLTPSAVSSAGAVPFGPLCAPALPPVGLPVAT